MNIGIDIDGVLNDWPYIKSVGKGNFDMLNDFVPDSIVALNYLIEKLKSNYEVELVISSTWRSNMKHTLKALKNNGLNFDGLKINKTIQCGDPCYRGEKEILVYLNEKEEKENYVIIDDEMFDYEKHFSMDKIIKTDLFKDSLRKYMVDDFLSKNNLIKRK